MRLIDVDEAIINFGFEWDDIPPTREEFVRFLKKQPTVDAVPVVRCRECKHWKPSGSKAGNSFSDMEYIGGCEFTNYYRSESDFCIYGEKRRGKDGTT